MYIPIGDRLLVTLHSITEELKTAQGIILPEGFKHDTDPPDLLRIEAIGTGPACELVKVGDMVLLRPGIPTYLVYTSKEKQLEYYIIDASAIIGRARMVKDEVNLDTQEN